MNLKRCGNGHYYDADEYPTCPKCGGQEKAPKKKEPVTGWLVCTEGGHYGQVYELKKGKNRVGGSADMDIALTADSQAAACCQVLQNRDVIVVGGSKLMFIPLCGPDFSWED